MNIYKIITKEQLDVKKVIIIILIIVILIGLIIIGKNIVEIAKNYKVYKQYEAQIIALAKQEEEEKAEIEKEKERIRQERIPKLTRRTEEII